MIKVKDSRYDGGYRFELSPPTKYHEKAQPLYFTIVTKMNKLQSISPPKFSKFKQHFENLLLINQRPFLESNKVVDMACEIIRSLIINEDDKDFRSELCIYLLERFLFLRLLCQKCSQTQAEEEFQKVFCCVLRSADESLKEYLKLAYPELCEVFAENPAQIEESEISFDEAVCAVCI